MNSISPRDFADTLIAGFTDPDKAVSALEQVEEIFSKEAQSLRFQLEQLDAKLRRITELRDTFQRAGEVHAAF